MTHAWLLLATLALANGKVGLGPIEAAPLPAVETVPLERGQPPFEAVSAVDPLGAVGLQPGVSSLEVEKGLAVERGQPPSAVRRQASGSLGAGKATRFDAKRGLTPLLRTFDRTRERGLGAVVEGRSAEPIGAPALGAVEADTTPEGVLGQVYAEHPEVEADLEARVAAAGLGSELSGGRWKAPLAKAMAPFFTRIGTPSTPAHRANLGEMLKSHTTHRAEGWTYLFRDHPLWKAPLEAYLAKAIADRKGDKHLELRSVGAGFGSEAFSLAITVHEALVRAGEDPKAWKVRIPTYDLSAMSLLAAGSGLYKLEKKDQAEFAALGAAHFEEKAPGLYRLNGPMRDWIEPTYVDLNRVELQAIATGGRPDVVFANYLLFHMRQKAASALAEHWLSGTWSRHGFLSMAQTLVAEVGESEREPVRLGHEMSFLGRFELTVGVVGRHYYGDSLRLAGGLRAAWEEWKRKRGPEAKAALHNGRSIQAGLRADPFKVFDADPGIVSDLRSLGAEVRLTTEDVTAGFDEAGVLHVNAGWVIAGPSAPARRAALARITAGLLRGPPAANPSSGRETIHGHTMEGAALKLEGNKLYWLTRKLVPVSDAFREDNAAKPETPADEAPARPRPSNPMPRGVKGLS